jgi:hypothetical protein
MSFRSLLSIASLTAFVAIMAIGYIVLPAPLRTSVSLSALALFGGAVSLLILSPLFMHPSSGNADAGHIASIGTKGTIVAVTLGSSILTLLLAVTGYDRIAWGMIVATISGFIVANLAFAKVPEFVNQAAERTNSASERSLWRTQIKSLMAQVNDAELAKNLSFLYEKLEFSASGQAGSADRLNSEIGESLNSLRQLLTGNDCDPNAVENQIRRVSSLIDQREASLGMARSKA